MGSEALRLLLTERGHSWQKKKCAHISLLILILYAGYQVPPAARGDREASRPRAEQREDGGPRGPVQRGEPLHRP